MHIQGRMFQIIRKFQEHQINLREGDTSLLKRFFNCDTIFKAQGMVWLCNEIKTIEYEELR